MPPSTSAQNAASTVQVLINGKPVSAPRGATVAAVLMQAGVPTHKSVAGESRAALCAMGICMECCAAVNGVQRVRTCQIVVEQGMEVVTG